MVVAIIRGKEDPLIEDVSLNIHGQDHCSTLSSSSQPPSYPTWVGSTAGIGTSSIMIFTQQGYLKLLFSQKN